MFDCCSYARWLQHLVTSLLIVWTQHFACYINLFGEEINKGANDGPEYSNKVILPDLIHMFILFMRILWEN